jgi:hypothetical protein
MMNVNDQAAYDAGTASFAQNANYDYLDTASRAELLAIVFGTGQAQWQQAERAVAMARLGIPASDDPESWVGLFLNTPWGRGLVIADSGRRMRVLLANGTLKVVQ